MKRNHLLLTLAILASLAGCKALRSNCHEPGAYSGARSIPPLVVPPGLEAPDTRGALRVPELQEPERPRGPSEPCLESPPKLSVPRTPAKPEA